MGFELVLHFILFKLVGIPSVIVKMETTRSSETSVTSTRRDGVSLKYSIYIATVFTSQVPQRHCDMMSN
jgi:hypothetical protein